jgi:hypothetical protein
MTEMTVYIDPDVRVLIAQADPNAMDFCELTLVEARAAPTRCVVLLLNIHTHPQCLRRP